MLEEYLALHRPLLAGANDPGTLFLGKRGPLNARQVGALSGNVTERFAGRRILPSWVRRAIALSWLQDHPDDWVTLSHILGLHTIPTIWPRPDTSSGMCASKSGSKTASTTSRLRLFQFKPIEAVVTDTPVTAACFSALAAQ